MKRSTFLTITSLIAFIIGSVALFFPAFLLESKGVLNNPAANIWMSEVGILLIAVAVVVFMIRNEKASLTLKSIFVGLLLIQSGLLFIEALAFYKGVITKAGGVIPNGILHMVLIFCLLYYLIGIHKELKRNT